MSMPVYLIAVSKVSESEHPLWLSSQLIIEILHTIYDYICLYDHICLYSTTDTPQYGPLAGKGR